MFHHKSSDSTAGSHISTGSELPRYRQYSNGFQMCCGKHVEQTVDDVW